MVLPEVIGGFVPIAAVVQLIARCGIVAVGIFFVTSQVFVQRVVLAQTSVPHILVGLDASVDTVSSVHQTHIVVACCYAVPSLTGFFKVSDVLITNLELVANPGESAIVRTAASAGSMDKSISIGLVIGTIKNQMIPQ